MTRDKFVVVVVALAGALHAAAGAWAFFAPGSFYDTVAPFPPYHVHFLHDLGAFMLGLGAGLLAALRWRDGLFVVLLGATVAASFHLAAHVRDRDLGGHASDSWLLGGWLLLLVAGLLARLPARHGVPATPRNGDGR